jgi:arsenate reductase
METTAKKSVLFLCTGNSCRSQMAEALTNHLAGESWIAFSAGTAPAGYVHPTALQVLEEIQIKHQGVSKSVEEFQGRSFDLVVTVCDQAEEECPLWLGDGLQIHRGFDDPAALTGTAEEKLLGFRKVRDQIQAAIPSLLALQDKD